VAALRSLKSDGQPFLKKLVSPSGKRRYSASEDQVVDRCGDGYSHEKPHDLKGVSGQDKLYKDELFENRNICKSMPAWGVCVIELRICVALLDHLKPLSRSRSTAESSEGLCHHFRQEQRLLSGYCRNSFWCDVLTDRKLNWEPHLSFGKSFEWSSRGGG
jgi:hypothetical protein